MRCLFGASFPSSTPAPQGGVGNQFEGLFGCELDRRSVGEFPVRIQHNLVAELQALLYFHHIADAAAGLDRNLVRYAVANDKRYGLASAGGERFRAHYGARFLLFGSQLLIKKSYFGAHFRKNARIRVEEAHLGYNRCFGAVHRRHDAADHRRESARQAARRAGFRKAVRP